MQSYSIKIPEISKKRLTATHDGVNNDLIILCDGKPLPKNDDYKYFTEDDYGNELVFKWECDHDGRLFISANDNPLEIEPHLAWFQWAAVGIPLILVPLGGLIGGIFGGFGAFLNMKIMRSSQPATLRYASCMGVSFACLLAYAAVAVGINALFGFGSGIFHNKFLAKTVEQITPSELESSRKSGDMPKVYADNPTESPLQFSIDGGKTVEIAPYSYATFRVKPGKRKFVFSSNGKEVDAISEQIPENKAALLSPKGAGEYIILTGTYSTNVFSMGGTMETAVGGKNFILADFGILEPLPEKIQIKLKSSEYTKTFSRTKLAKALPRTPGTIESYVIISKYWEKPENPFIINDTEYALRQLLDSLAGEPRKPEHMHILLDYAAKSQKYVLEAALKSLAPYMDQIPDDALAKFAAENESVSSGGMSSDSPAINGRSGWAIRTLIQKGKINLLLDKFSSLPTRNQQLLLQCVADSEKDEAINLALQKALDSANPADNDSVRPVWRMIISQGFRPDDDMMRKTDKFIAAVPHDSTRRNMAAEWEKKLTAIANSGSNSEYIKQRIVQSLKAGNELDPKAIGPLVKQGFYKELLSAFPSMEGRAKLDLIQMLPKKDTDKVPEGALQIAWLALDDPGERVSASAMSYLAGNNPSDIEFLRKTWAKLNAIQDEKERKKFHQLIWSCSYSKVGNMSLPEICAVAAESPNYEFVKLAFDCLQARSDDRIPNFSELLKAYPSVASEQNRIWIMKELGDVSYLQFASRKPPELELFKKLFSLGLADKSSKVRAAALNSSFRLARSDFPEEKTAEKIISSDLGEGGDEVRRNYEFWICGTWDNLTRDRNFRAKAIGKIVAVVQSTKSEEVAKFASSRLDHPSPEEKDYIASLAKIAAENKFRECRFDAMSHLSAIDFSKDAAVTKVFLGNLADKDAEIRWRAFMALAHKCQKYNEPFRSKNLPALKTAALKESDQKTKAEMDRFLKDHLDAFEKPQIKPK